MTELHGSEPSSGSWDALTVDDPGPGPDELTSDSDSHPSHPSSVVTGSDWSWNDQYMSPAWLSWGRQELAQVVPHAPVAVAEERPPPEASSEPPSPSWPDHLICCCDDATADSMAQSLLRHGLVINKFVSSPTTFSRWLVTQSRGEVSPWTVLVTNRRDAKPCAMAILAARTGDESLLRRDAQRSRLVPVSGTLDRMVQVAIRTLYILLQDTDQGDARLPKWAVTMDLDIRLVGDIDQLRIQLL
ncbi:MAG: hypothetical protein NZ807_02920 [Dehalococcoidia bacterium]|nr:hypothetical protein [Dehalococcoidia bacterium]